MRYVFFQLSHISGAYDYVDDLSEMCFLGSPKRLPHDTCRCCVFMVRGRVESKIMVLLVFLWPGLFGCDLYVAALLS